MIFFRMQYIMILPLNLTCNHIKSHKHGFVAFLFDPNKYRLLEFIGIKIRLKLSKLNNLLSNFLCDPNKKKHYDLLIFYFRLQTFFFEEGKMELYNKNSSNSQAQGVPRRPLQTY